MVRKISQDTRVRTQAIGDKAEDLFTRACDNHSLEYYEATKEENMFQHIDFHVKGRSGFRAFDVKAFKKSSQDGNILIEFKNVKGNAGWIDGGANFIAFDIGGHFICVPRKRLKQVAEGLCDLTNIVPHISQSLYKGYTRKLWGRDDLVTMITLDDIEENIEVFKLFY